MKSVKLGFFLFLCLFGFQFNYPVAAKSFDEGKKIFELVNREREKRGLEMLIWNSKLADLARSYSQKMAREKFFDHFDNEGNSVAERAKAMRIKNWRLIGENLFLCDGFLKFSEVAVRGWMKSPTHRDNILDPDFSETGIGIARAKDGKIYVTQVFMRD